MSVEASTAVVYCILNLPDDRFKLIDGRTAARF